MLFKILLPALLFLPLISAGTVSIFDAPGYASQRPCARDCFYIGFAVNGGPDELASHLDCDVDPIEDSCFCRPDLQSVAVSYVNSCVYRVCSKNTLDSNSAVTIYKQYCTSAGFQALTPTTTSASSTIGALISPTTVTVTAIQTVFLSSGERRAKMPFEGLVQQLRL